MELRLSAVGRKITMVIYNKRDKTSAISAVLLKKDFIFLRIITVHPLSYPDSPFHKFSGRLLTKTESVIPSKMMI
jgi:hypothetical protein